MNNFKSTFQFYLLPILSGLFIGTSFIPFPPWAALFGLVPLWIFWLKNPLPKESFLGGWITGIIFTLIGFYWVAYTAKEFGLLPWPIALLVLVLFCFLSHIHWAIVGLTWGYLNKYFPQIKNHWWSLLLLPILIGLFEYYFPVMFPWNFGYTWFYAGLPIFHLAEWIGFSGISWITIFLNFPIFLFFTIKKRKLYPIISLLMIIILNFIGYAIKTHYKEGLKTLNVLVVQANIGNLEKQFAENGWGFRNQILQKYIHLTENALSETNKKIDFVIWPETAFPDQIWPEQIYIGLSSKLSHFLKSQNISLITGAYSRSPNKKQATNSLFSFNSQGQLTDPPHHKSILLAFGEYLPFGNMFPTLKSLLPMVADFYKGQGPSILNQDQIKIGGQICYEGLFPYFSKKLSDLGTQVFVNVTNDSWYGKTSQPQQHMYMTLARAIEFRRPLIRSTNTGITTAISALGDINIQSPLHKEWSQVFHIPVKTNPEATFYQKVGIFLGPLIMWFLFFGIIGGLVFERNFRRN